LVCQYTLPTTLPKRPARDTRMRGAFEPQRLLSLPVRGPLRVLAKTLRRGSRLYDRPLQIGTDQANECEAKHSLGREHERQYRRRHQDQDDASDLASGSAFVAAAAGLRPERAEANAMFVKTSGATIRVLRKVDGPPLLLLHGHPETHVTWHRIATDLSRE